jgi:predicted sulfurtransferase
VHLYLAKYGYNTDWAGDLEDGLIVAADVDPDEDVDALLLEESARRAEYFKKLKGVRVKQLPR